MSIADLNKRYGDEMCEEALTVIERDDAPADVLILLARFVCRHDYRHVADPRLTAWLNRHVSETQKYLALKAGDKLF